MAIFRGTFLSRVLECETTLQVVIPWDIYDFGTKTQHSRVQKTMILLHGLRQSGDGWIRMTSAARYAEELGFCLVIPDVQRSFCTDMAYGMKYFTYINEELPRVIDAMFRIPTDREHLYIGGLSMGGYGALKSALTYPQNYRGAVCLSSALYHLNRPDVCLGISSSAYGKEELQGIIGMELKAPASEQLRLLAQRASSQSECPCIYMACGDDDGNHDENEEMSDYLNSLGFVSHFDTIRGGHTWDVWDKGIFLGMKYMPGK